jgi:hypothetical protein
MSKKLTKHRWNNYFWHFTLVLIKINYGQIEDQTGLFHTTNPVFYTSGNRFVCRTGTFGNLWFFHLSRRKTVIQDLLVRRKFSLVPDNRTNVNVEAWDFFASLNSHDSTNYDFNILFISHLLTDNKFLIHHSYHEKYDVMFIIGEWRCTIIAVFMLTPSGI